MIRLLVHHSIEDRLAIDGVGSGKIHNWCSEALMSSPFLAQQRGEKRAEGFTHADVVFGDLSVDFATRGEICVPDAAKLFGVIEVKMASKLSSGTTHAPNYNQASRTLACIAHKTMQTNADTVLLVAAPENKIQRNKLRRDTDMGLMLSQIRSRFETFADVREVVQNRERILEKAERCTVKVISYEEWLDAFPVGEHKSLLVDFYAKTRRFNRV